MAAHPRRSHTPHILLVEDIPTNQKLATIKLKKQGYDVTVANNGVEALAQFEQNAFDLILMDVQMPEMNGHETTRRIRALEGDSGVHVPIIALTAFAMQKEKERCYECGMDDFVAKPIDFHRLFFLIKHFLAEQLKRPATEQKTESVSLDSGPFDLSAVAPLMDDPAGWADLVGVLIEDIDESILGLKQAMARSDESTVESIALALKGLASNYGLSTITTQADTILSQLKQKPLGDFLDTHVKLLRQECERVKDYVETVS